MKCLDTDLLVALLRRQGEGTCQCRPAYQEGLTRRADRATTAVSASEFFYGASKWKMAEENMMEAQKLLSRLEVLPLSLSSAEKAGTIFGGLELKGNPIEFRDAMIAAIVVDHKLTYVTRNRKDYSRIPGLSLEEW